MTCLIPEPDGGKQPGAPGTGGVNMHQLYKSNNLIYTHTKAYIIPASNNIATGGIKETFPQGSTHFFGYNSFPFTRKSFQERGLTEWASPVRPRVIDEEIEEEDDFSYSYQGRRGGGGGGGGGTSWLGKGLCGNNFRRLHMWMGPNSVQKDALIDSGTAQAMVGGSMGKDIGAGGSRGGGGGGGGGGSFSVQTKFDPNPQPISMPCINHDQGNDDMFIPAPMNTITQRVNLVFTRDYTISISLGQGGIVTYDCTKNQVVKGDVLEGKWAPPTAIQTMIRNMYL